MTSIEALAAARISLDLANRRAAKLLETHPTVRMKAIEEAVWRHVCGKDATGR